MKYNEQKGILKILKDWEQNNQHLGFIRCELGYKIIGGKKTKQLSFRILVPKKLSPMALGENSIPKEIEGLPTDVIEYSYRQECDTVDPKNIQQELTGGLEIQNSKLSDNWGTLGCIVQQESLYFGLSCHHVIFGPDHNGMNGRIYQPSKGRSSIGIVENNLLRFDKSLDCAIFKLTNRNPSQSMIINGECGILAGNKYPVIDDIVYKFGATTGRTAGRIISIGTDHKFSITNIDLDKTPLSKTGDSGSIWYTKTGNTIKGIGLHLGKDKSGTVIASPLVDIFRKLQISHYNQ